MTRSTLALALMLAAVPAGAQEPPVPLTLEDAVAQAVANSRRLAELQAREEAAGAAADARRAAGLPALAVTAGYTRTNHVDEFGIAQPGQPPRIIYPDIPDNYRARLDLQWPIFTGGRTGALERAARAERAAAASDREAARADLVLEVTRAYWALVTSREAEAVLARSVANIQAHVRDLRNRLAQGLIPPNEVLTAEAQAARRRLQAIEAGNARRIAEADLRRLLDRAPGDRIEPSAALEAPPAVDDAEALARRARERRPERAALEQRVAAAGARAEAAGASALPQIAFNGGYDYARPNVRIFPRVGDWRYSWDLSLNVAWTLWDGGRRQAEQAEAAALSRAAASRVGAFDRQVAFEIEQARLDLESSRAAIEAASEGVRAATEARRVVSDRFAAGVATSTDVLDADLAVLEAELDRTRALANARLAAARLARAAGATP